MRENIAGRVSGFPGLSRRVGLFFRGWSSSRRHTLRMMITADDRLESVRAFYDLYENTVEILLAAANFGPTDALEVRYATHRAAVLDSYPAIKPYLLAYLRMTVSDAQYGTTHLGKASDAFEALFGQPTLDRFLATDDGEMILRITRTRESLTLYTEHLRYLLATR